MSAMYAEGPCRRYDCWLTAYVDDELDAVHCLELEEHLSECGGCAETIASLRATRTSLRASCQIAAPASLRERLQLVLQEESAASSADAEDVVPIGAAEPVPGSGAPEADTAGPPPPEAPPSEDGAGVERSSRTAVGGATRSTASAPRQLGKLSYVVPLAAAATFALVFGATRLQEAEVASEAEEEPKAASSSATSALGARVQAASLEGLLEDLVDQHAHPPPPETTDPEGLRRFDPYIGVRVRRPSFDRVDATYIGARMHQRAALLQYMLRNRHRVTMYVFDPKRIPLRAERLERRHYGAQHVYAGKIRGYGVAASKRHGIGYALASDLGDDEAAKLLLMAEK